MDWNMEFNTSQCKALNMSRKIVETQRAYGVLNSSTLEVVSQTTDRRITISNHLSWNNPNKARKKLGLIRRLCRLNHQTRKVLYCSMIRPQLDYASELWSHNYNNNFNHFSWNGNPNKTRKKLGLIRRLCRLNHHQTRKVLYCSMVRPQLQYASGLWSPYTIKPKLYLESV